MTKLTQEIAKELDDMALWLRTLGHPLRLRIAAGLLKESACVIEIWECLDMPQATVSQHLRVMKENGVLVSNREGKRVRYSLSSDKIANLVQRLQLNLPNHHN